MTDRKPICFIGRSLDDLRLFPRSARRAAGYQLDRVQQGLEPDDWKPLKGVGAGVREIRIRDVNGAFRVIYVARFREAIFVLHCFQKRSEKTAQRDIDLIARRYRTLQEETDHEA
jgi:phage-related protein